MRLRRYKYVVCRRIYITRNAENAFEIRFFDPVTNPEISLILQSFSIRPTVIGNCPIIVNLA
jgi:hypothetical protein